MTLAERHEPFPDAVDCFRHQVRCEHPHLGDRDPGGADADPAGEHGVAQDLVARVAARLRDLDDPAGAHRGIPTVVRHHPLTVGDRWALQGRLAPVDGLARDRDLGALATADSSPILLPSASSPEDCHGPKQRSHRIRQRAASTTRVLSGRVPMKETTPTTDRAVGVSRRSCKAIPAS